MKKIPYLFATLSVCLLLGCQSSNQACSNENPKGCDRSCKSDEDCIAINPEKCINKDQEYSTNAQYLSLPDCVCSWRRCKIKDD